MTTTPKKFRLERDQCHRCVGACDCGHTLYLRVNGAKGYGSAAWVHDLKEGRALFACRFLGWEFTADSDEEVREQLERRINMVRDEPVSVSLY